MSIEVYDKSGIKKEIAEKNELPQLIFSGRKNIDGEKLVINELYKYSVLLIHFIYEGNWYFSKLVFTQTNSNVLEIPVIGKEFYVYTYNDGINLVNARGYDLSKVFMISIIGLI